MAEEKELDLEKLRDERCIPVTREIMSEMATTLVASDASKVGYNDIILKSLGAFLKADLNITFEVPYVPQLILGALAGLNKAVHECEIIPIDDARYSAIAGRILTILSEAEVDLVVLEKQKESDVDFSSVKKELNKLFKENKLTLLEVQYIMDNIFDAFKEFQAKLGESVDDSTKRAEQKLFKVKDMTEITLKMLDKVLTEK